MLNDAIFMSIFLKRQNDKYWNKIEYVQTNLKARIGIGKPIFIRFYANYSLTHPELPIHYDFDSFGPDNQLSL